MSGETECMTPAEIALIEASLRDVHLKFERPMRRADVLTLTVESHYTQAAQAAPRANGRSRTTDERPAHLLGENQSLTLKLALRSMPH